MKYEVLFEGYVRDNEGQILPSDVLEAHFDEVMEELLRLNVEDAAVSGALARGIVEVSVTVEADDVDKAQGVGNGVIRAAIHAADGATPGWAVDWCKVTTVRSDVSADLISA